MWTDFRFGIIEKQMYVKVAVEETACYILLIHSLYFTCYFSIYMLSCGFHCMCAMCSKELQCCDQSFVIRHCGQSKHTRGLFFHFLFVTVVKGFLAISAAAGGRKKNQYFSM